MDAYRPNHIDKKRDRITLIDGHNQMWRACIKFGAVQPDVPDEVIFAFNFFRNLRPLIENASADKAFFVLEGHPQFRYDMFADYKANRIIKNAEGKSKESNDRFLRAKDIIVPLMLHLPITTCRAASYEADDVIATLCENMREEDLTIISNDSDYIQLLQKNFPVLEIYNPIKKENMAAPVYPYVPWKCLRGDVSDNIPSLMGPKTAEKTIQDPVLFKKFMDVPENKANFNMNRDLIEFRYIPLEEIEMREGVANFDKLKEEFMKMKFESITNDKSWKKYVESFDTLKY